MNKIYYQDGVLFPEQVRAKIGGEDCHVFWSTCELEDEAQA